MYRDNIKREREREIAAERVRERDDIQKTCVCERGREKGPACVGVWVSLASALTQTHAHIHPHM